MTDRLVTSRAGLLALAIVLVTVAVGAATVGVGGAQTAQSSHTIDGCGVINQSGTYELTGDVTGIDNTDMIGGQDTRAVCLDVRADDVVIDGNGHVFDAADDDWQSEQSAIHVNGSVDGRQNVTVRNVALTDWPRGILVDNADDVLVDGIDIHVRETRSASFEAGVDWGYGTSSNVTVRDSRFEDTYDAVSRGDGANIVVENNTVYGAIQVVGENATVVDNDVRAHPDGSDGRVRVDGTDGLIARNAIEDGTVEVSGSGTTVRSNVVRNLSTPVFAMDVSGDDHAVRNNTIENAPRGLAVGGSGHVLRNNAMAENDENFHLGLDQTTTDPLGTSDFASLDIDTSNTVDGEPIHLFAGVSGHTFDGDGYVAYVDSEDVTIRDVSLSNSTDGAFLYNVTGATVENATFTEHANGIEVANSSDVTVSGSTFADNTVRGIFGQPDGGGLETIRVANNTVTGTGQGVDTGLYGITARATNLTIRDNDVSGGEHGIYGAGGGVTVRTNDVTGTGGHGIFVEGANTSIRSNAVTNAAGTGIVQDYWNGRNHEIVGNTVENSGNAGIRTQTGGVAVTDNVLLDNADAGVHFKGEGNHVARNNTARRNEFGIRLYDYHSGLGEDHPISDSLVANNTVTDNTDTGIAVGTTSENNTIRNNDATGNGDGILLEDVGHHRVVDNNVSGNTDDGIYFHDYHSPYEFTPTVFRNNTATDNAGDGIELSNAKADYTDQPSGPFVVRENLVRDNTGQGIVVGNSLNVTVADNGRVSGNGETGIEVTNSANVSVTNHTVTDNGVVASYGVAGFFAGGSDVTVSNLTADSNADIGIWLQSVDGVSLDSSVSASDNGGDGLFLENARNVTVDGVPADRNGGHGVEIVDTQSTTVRDLSASDNGLAGLSVSVDNGPDVENVSARNLTLERNAVGVDTRTTHNLTVANSTIRHSNASKARFVAETELIDGEEFPVNGTGIVGEALLDGALRNNTIAGNDGRGIVVARAADGSAIVGNAITDNGGHGVEYRAVDRSSTVVDNHVADNGGTDLYPPAAENGDSGLYFEGASNVTVRANTIETNVEHGVWIRGGSTDATVVDNTVRSHTTANASGHGVFVDSLLLATPDGITIEDNAVTDNDYGITLFDQNGSVVRGNDVGGNDVGVRFGSSTIPVSIQETTECTNDGVLETRNVYGGATAGVIADNDVESERTGLKVITHPSQVNVCDGSVVLERYDDPTIEDTTIANNHVNASNPFNVSRTRLDYPSTAYQSELNGTNAWNATKTRTGNVLGGPYRAGNAWTTPDGTGVSQTCDDADGDGICDTETMTVGTNNVDHLPLAQTQPGYVTAAIDSTTAPVVSGEPLGVTATFTNTGDNASTQSASLSIDGSTIDSTSISLAAGASTTETFTWTPTAADVGTHTATIDSGSATAETEVTVRPNLSVTIDGTNAPITDTQTLAVETTIANNRDTEVTETVELRDFDGTVVDSREVTLSGGASTSAQFAWETAAGDDATGDVSVLSQHDTATETVTIRSGLLTGCQTIDQPGRYRLGSDLSVGSAPCLTVGASEVTIDGQGHAVNGTGSGTGVLVDVASGATANVSLANLTVRDVDTAVSATVPDDGSLSGIALDSVSTETTSGTGLAVAVGENGVVEDVAVTDSTLSTGDGGVRIEDDYGANATVRDVDIANSTVDVGGYDPGISLSLTDETSRIDDVRIADNAISASETAVLFDYSGDGTTVESVQVVDNDVESASNQGLTIDGAATGTTARNVHVAGNNVSSGSEGLSVALESGDVSVENLTIADNVIATDGSDGLSLEAADSGVTVQDTELRNNTIRSASIGMYLDVGGSYQGGASYDLAVVENDVDAFTSTGIDVYEVAVNESTRLSITDNTITTASGSTTGVALETTNGSTPVGATIDVSRNDVETGGDAVAIDSGSDWLGPIDVTENDLDVPGDGVRNDATGVGGQAWVNATGNYWGSADGPSSPGPDADPVTGTLADGAGSSVTNGSTTGVANVHFDPFESSPVAGSNVSITIDSTNSPVTAGETLSVTATVENTGSTQLLRTVGLATDGGTVRDSTDVTLAGGESRTVTLEWATASADAGTYTATVQTTGDADSTEVTLEDGGPGDATPIGGCTVIDSPGTYELSGSIASTSAETCIEITASNVTFDGQGHAIERSGGSGQYAISAGMVSNVTVENVVLDDWGEAGVSVFDATDVAVRDSILRNNQTSIDVSQTSSDVLIQNNTVRNVTPHGIGPSGSNVTVRDNVVLDGEDGITVLDAGAGGVTLVDNSVQTNSNAGIRVQADGVTLRNNTATDNVRGVWLYGASDITANATTFADNVHGTVESTPGSGGAAATNNTFKDADLGYDGATVTFTVGNATVTSETLQSAPALPSGTTDIGVFLSAGMLENGYVDATVAYDDAAVSHVDESTLSVWHNQSTWTDVGGSLDTGANTIAKNLTTSGHYAVLADDGSSGQAPTAAFDYAPSSPVAGDTVTFDASGSADPDGSITTYEWDVDGDGSYEKSGASPTVDHSYPSDGTYDVTLRVTDDDGNTDTVSKTVTVAAQEPPTATFTIAPTTPNPTETVTFDASAASDPNGTITTYEWDVDGDGNYERAGASPTIDHAYASAGTYDVTLRVTDDDGATNATTRPVTVVDTTDPTVELTGIGRSSTSLAAPTGQTIHTNGSLAFELDANGTPGTAVSSSVTLRASFANFDSVVAATHDGGDTWTGTTDLSGLVDDGNYSVNASAVDAGGNLNETAADVTVRLDRESPTLGASVSRVNDTAGQVILRASEPLADAPSITVETPNGTTETATIVDSYPRLWNATFSLNGTGQYNVTATGTDRAGNVGTGTATSVIGTVSTGSGATSDGHVSTDTDSAATGNATTDADGTTNNTATVVLRPSGLFVDVTTDQPATDSVVLTESDTPVEPLASGTAGVSFLNGEFGDAIAGNLSHAEIGIPVTSGALPPGVDASAVEIRHYDEAAATWASIPTTVENRSVDGTTREYWVANVTHFSTYGAVVVDDTAPTIESATPSGDLDPGTTNATVEFTYGDAVSAVDPSTVSLSFDGSTVTGAENASITGEWASYNATGLAPGDHTASVTVTDAAGNSRTGETTFTIPDGDGGGPGLPPAPPGDGDDPEPGQPIEDANPDEPGVQVIFPDGPLAAISFDDQSAAGAGNVVVTEPATAPGALTDRYGAERVLLVADVTVPESVADSDGSVVFRLSPSALGDYATDSLRVVRVDDGSVDELETHVDDSGTGTRSVTGETSGFSTVAVVAVDDDPSAGDGTDGTDSPAGNESDGSDGDGSADGVPTVGPAVALLAFLLAAAVAARRDA
ncbi:right-handed parallel beta-helix repeat-containing protein [Halovivax cerinus]|uniref:Right-handed parallel beta-helix repeat-containing protein n=1 Tax=Halovivax cerinus TaxID=1487865 RepID=A0ABD5NRX3_9EURY|nr:right-handed parallel beta-helix repeat-containing protein [Halovivax cerinus]